MNGYLWFRIIPDPARTSSFLIQYRWFGMWFTVRNPYNRKPIAWASSDSAAEYAREFAWSKGKNPLFAS